MEGRAENILKVKVDTFKNTAFKQNKQKTEISISRRAKCCTFLFKYLNQQKNSISILQAKKYCGQRNAA